MRKSLVLIALFMSVLNLSACSHAKKKTTPELSKMEGKKVALIEIVGEATQRKIVEVALVNQLMKHGSFILVPKQDVELARQAPDQDPMDGVGVSKRVGADYALWIKVNRFETRVDEGYSKEVVEDSLMKKERGGDGKVERLYKVKSMTGDVSFELRFLELAKNEWRVANAEESKQTIAEAKEKAIHLPPRMRYLEDLSGEAFAKFFSENQ